MSAASVASSAPIPVASNSRMLFAWPSAMSPWRLIATFVRASTRYMSSPHASPWWLRRSGESREQAVVHVAPDLHAELVGQPLEQRGAAPVHGRAVDAADEDDGMRPLAVRVDVVEHPGVEPEWQVLRVEPGLAQPRHEVRERRGHEVELGGTRVARRLRAELGRDADAAPPHRRELGRLEEPEVLEVDDVGLERLDLGACDPVQDAVARQQPGGAGQPRGPGERSEPQPVLARPRELERKAVHDDLARHVAEPVQMVRVDARRAEPGAGQRGELLVVRAPGEPRVRAVVARREGRVVDVDDEHAHAGWDGRRGF